MEAAKSRRFAAKMLDSRVRKPVADHEKEEPTHQSPTQQPNMIHLQRYVGKSGFQRLLTTQQSAPQSQPTIQRFLDDWNLNVDTPNGGGWNVNVDTPWGGGSASVGPNDVSGSVDTEPFSGGASVSPDGVSGNVDTRYGSASASGNPSGWNASVDTDDFSGSASASPNAWSGSVDTPIGGGSASGGSGGLDDMGSSLLPGGVNPLDMLF